MKKSNKIKFGLMCSGFVLRKWEADSIKKLLSNDNIQLTLLIVDCPENYKAKGFLQKILSVKFSKLFFIIYSRFLLKPKSRQLVDLKDLLSGIPSVTCRVKYTGRHSQNFSEQDIKTIREYNLDFILRFGFNIIRGGILDSAKYGVWSFHHDDETKYRGAPPCFWEIYNKDAVTGSVLQRLTDKLDAGVILKKGYFRTKMYSYKKNIDYAYFSSANWPYYVCNDIFNNNASYLHNEPSRTNAPIYSLPHNSQLLLFIFKLYYYTILKIIDNLFMKDIWNIGIAGCNINTLPDAGLPKVKFVAAKTKHRFFADPFGFLSGNNLCIVAEELVFEKRSKGTIAFFLVSMNGEVLQKKTLLQGQDHLSYPYIFREEDKIYLIPESSRAQSLDLYELFGMGENIDWKCNLILGRNIVDPTIIKFNNKYWLFYSKHGDESDPDIHLYISYSDHLFGPYTEHKKNPVKIDVRSSRPAGTPFVKDGILYRPAQNFSKTYGGSIIINKVNVLTEDEFEEEPVKEIFSCDPYYKDGIHTLSYVSENITLLDCKRKVFSFDQLYRKLV